MDKQEIIEGNKLIAEFMGAKWWPKKNKLFVKYSGAYEFPNIRVGFSPEQLKYRESFDWLIPVEERIYSLGSECAEKMDYLTRKFDHWQLEYLWNACVQFIKWYNSQNKPS